MATSHASGKIIFDSNFSAVTDDMSPRLYMCWRVIRRNFKLKYYVSFLCSLVILNYFGAFTHFFELDFYKEFQYPVYGDVIKYATQLRKGQEPEVEPINFYNFSLLSTCANRCDTEESDKLRLVYIVKSAIPHFARRQAIRSSWGFQKRFSDVEIRTVFLLGTTVENPAWQELVYKEHLKFQDIVQINFIDTYYNNTIKTMSGLKWVVEFCSNSQFYFFSDDDMYVSTKNVLRFLRNPTNYPEYLEAPVISLNELTDIEIAKKYKKYNSKFIYTNKDLEPQRRLNQVLDFELPADVVLFTGFVFFSSPHRHKSSKWYVSLEEYPFHMWPPYVTAGSYILSREAVFKMYYTSFFTKHFRFDDIYLGLLAIKSGIEPFHCDQFHFYKKEYSLYNYKYVIASHGYDDTEELLTVWNEQKSIGYA